jgi:hypothetical protein
MKRIRFSLLAAFLTGVGFAAGAFAGPREQLGKITGAAKHLDAAQMSLADAADDFGGHKAKASTLIAQAQTELKQAESWAATH